MSIPNRFSPEGVELSPGLSRRGFLRLAAAAGGAAALAPFLPPGVGPALAAARKSKPDFPRHNGPDGGAAKPPAGILQTGINQVEVNGDIYRPLVDTAAMTELILSLALLYQDEETQTGVSRWLEGNTLELEIFAPGVFSLDAGKFRPPRSGDAARISISAEVIKEVHFPGSSDLPVYALSRFLGDLRPEATLSHEIQHFLGWVSHPEDYAVWIARVTAVTSFCLRPLFQIAAAVGFANSKWGKRIHGDKPLIRGAVFLSTALAAGEGINRLILPAVDVHAKEKYSGEGISRLLDENPSLAALNLQALSLQPIT